MRHEYIEPVIGSTMKVLDTVLDSDITKGDVSLLSKCKMDGEVSIVINVVGDSEGIIIVNMDKETALNICNIMTGDESSSMTVLGMDAVSELTNMIAGNAISVLNDLGYGLKVSPPLTFTEGASGEGLELLKNLAFLKANVNTDRAMEVIQIPFFTECGEIEMNMAMRVV
jgi:chemotaxis protein CheX